MKKIFTKLQTSMRVTLILVIVNILLLQWLSYGLYFRFDISRSGNMRVTKASKQILRELPSPLTIEAYFSEDVPVAYIQSAKTITDFLREYAATGGRNVRLVFIDPDKNKENLTRAQNLGITPLAMGSINQKKQEIANVYFSVVLLYQDKQQVLPNILSTGMLEYQMTARAYAMAYPQERGIAFFAQGGFSLFNQANPVQGFSAADELLTDFYGHMQPLTNLANIPPNIKTLFLVQPQTLSPAELLSIDQFLLQGNNVIVAASGMDIDFQTQQARESSTNTNDFWQHYGFNIDKNMLNQGKEILPLRQPPNLAGQSQEIYMPVWMLISEKNLDPQSSITRKLPNIFVPWSSSLQLFPENLPYKNKEKKEKFNAVVLARTTKNSWSQSGFNSIAPDSQRNLYFNYRAGLLPKENFASSSVAAYWQGYFTSYFADKPIPEEFAAQRNNLLKESTYAGKLMVIATPYALSDVGIMQSMNSYFLLNVLDSMNGLQDLVQARSSEEENPRLPLLSAWVKQTVNAVVFLFPVLLIVFAAIFHFKRRRALATLSYSANNADLKK